MNMLATRLLTAAALIFAASDAALGGGLRERVDSLCRAYDFPAAIDACIQALKTASDDAATDEINAMLATCRSGRTMMNSCTVAKVVAKAKFDVDEFIYYYPVDPDELIFNPSDVDRSGGDTYSKAIFSPRASDILFYSRAGGNGGRDLCCAFREDNGWGSPLNLPDEISSEKDEIYPFVSADGKSLYFASEGHGSIGGFDLFVSRRNSNGEWSEPENLGFPYSSPFNDFLLYNTPDGKYTVFASDRDCPGSDSLYLYVLEYEARPSRTVVETPEELRSIQSLNPPVEQVDLDNSSAMDNDIRDSRETIRYEQKMEEVRELRIIIGTLEKELELLKARYFEEQTPELRRQVEEKESALKEKRAALDSATRELQAIEMDFLSSGVVLDIDKAKADSRKDVVGAGTGYIFTRMHIGQAR